MALATAGCTFVAQAGSEPLADDGRHSVIFDWTVLEAVVEALKKGQVVAAGPQGRLVACVATHKTQDQIPEEKRALWDYLVQANAIRVEYIEEGWTSGAVRRERQAQLGDVFIAISGGEGVEHLGRLYAGEGKPVIPLDLNLGASEGDGSGGAVRLHWLALAHPEQFFRQKDLSGGSALLTAAATRDGAVAVDQVVPALMRLLVGLRDPEAFYVRLLNPEVPEHAEVERFFRNVVDPLVDELGYPGGAMGETPSEDAFMNVEIFSRIHYSALSVVDLTGLRLNCMMELGYAFGRLKPVILTAMEGTKVPFDPNAIDTHFWNTSTSDSDRIAALREYRARTANRPPLVRPRGMRA